jgi:excisionase family DNA binding protein
MTAKKRRARAPVVPAYHRISYISGTLSASDSFVRELIRSGKLPAIRVGSHWRISAAGFEAYLAAQEGR